MPVEFSIEMFAAGQEEFHALDRRLMRHAFGLYNSLGRFCDEPIYQNELARRCGEDGIKCHREVEIRVSHQDFTKSYYLDLLVEHCAIYELKAVDCLIPPHQNQLINYLLLTQIHHGKLLNFRSKSVESRFVSTTLDRKDRLNFHLNETEWKECSESMRLKKTLISLLEDWGAYLDMNLYRDALLHLTSGPEGGLQSVSIEVLGRSIGSQKMCLLNAECAWHLSTIKNSLATHEKHILRLMQHTRLQSIYWINLNQGQVTLKTLQK